MGADFSLQSLVEIIVIILVVMFAATVHEVSHGWVAWREGDPTARMQNRLTLNPLAHIDPFLSIIMPIIFYLSAGFVFGGAKPVPVNPYYLRDPRRSMIKVSAAGPLSNLGLALVGSLVLRLILFLFDMITLPTVLAKALFFFFIIFIQINIVLFVFNLIPVPPLDGSKILQGFLPARYESYFIRIESYGMIILIVLLVSGVLGETVFPLIQVLFRLFTGLS
ncbi:site-2 protease family protein [bacterium]|nr:site-2 protease family protein [bacterium]